MGSGAWHHAPVTMQSAPTDPIRTEQLDLVLLTHAWVRAYVEGTQLPDLGFCDPHDFLSGSEQVVHLRAEQLAIDPAEEPWLMRALVLRKTGTAVGYANFHAGPDERGMVEIGYRVLPAYRRRGLATEAADGMRAWAATHGARVLRAAIGADNHPSLAMIRRAGFVPVGEQVDDIDGLELVFERPA